MSNWVKGGILIVVVAVLAVIYFTYDPSSISFFPKCVFHEMTGLECPGCGSQRAVHAALHGSLVEALRLNPFIIISIPYGVGLIVILIFKTSFTAKLRSKLLHPYVVYAYSFFFIGWWILRNII